MPIILYKNCNPVENVYNEVYKSVKTGEYSKFILIVPTRRKVRELQRELLKLSPNATAPAFNLFTLETFAAKLYEIFFPPAKFLNATTQAVFFEQAIKNCKKNLKYFISATRENVIPKGTFNKIIAVIKNFKESGIYISNLYAELQNAEENEIQKLKDILLIYQEYEKLLNDSYVDSGSIFKKLNELIYDDRIIKKFFTAFPILEKLFITGFDEFKNPEITLIDNVSNFSNNGKSIETVISFDYHNNNDELFGHLKENYEKFIEMGFKVATSNTENNHDFRGFVINNLFKEAHHSSIKDFKDKITLIVSESRQEEVETIAKIIKYKINENPGTDLSKICISMNQPQLYTKLFHEVFNRYGIPANITDRFSLDQSPVVVSIISLLSVLQNNYQRRDLMRTLSSPYFSFKSPEGEIDSGNLVNISASLKVNYGKNLWYERIDKRINQINVELNDIDDEIARLNYIKEIEALEKAKKDFQLFEQYLVNIKNESTPTDFRLNLLKTLENLCVSENILDYNYDNPDLLERDTRAYQQFVNILDELTSLIIFEQGKDQINHLNFYVDKLKAAISQTRYNIRQKYGYGVYVTSFEETRGLEFETMFIIGLVDGEFPLAYTPEIFFSKERQKQKEKYFLTQNRYLFYQCLTNFSDHLYLSYPKQDGDLELVKSSFVDALLEVFEVENYDHELKPKLDHIVFCEEDLFAKIGHNLATVPESVKLEAFDEKIRDSINFIHNVINLEKKRYDSVNRFEYNGYISGLLSDEALKKLNSQKYKVYSITQLERYARCPFNYFLKNLLKLSVISELEEGISSLEKGTIIHEVLFEFYKNRIQKGLPYLTDCDEEQLQAAIDEILKIAEKKLETILTNDVLAFLDKELILGTANQKGLLQEFIDYEKSRKLEVKPKYFEAAFGGNLSGNNRIDNAISISDPIEINEYKIRGKVDRIDLGENYFAIIDYKTGRRNIDVESIKEGLTLQLPVYLYAVEKILKTKLEKDFSPAAAIYYNFSDKISEKILIGQKDYMEKAYPKTRQYKGIFEKESEFKEIISLAIDYVKKYIENISAGNYPLAEDKNLEIACKYCDFDKICRKQLEKEF